MNIPMTLQGNCFEYLGHLISPTGDWTAHERAASSRLALAAGKVGRASAHPVCNLLYTARLTEQHAVSSLPYTMATVGYSQQWLDKARTALAQPVMARAGLHREVACANVYGTHLDKGLGITDPHALDAGVKASTAVRLLNTAAPLAASLLAAHAMHALQAALATGSRTSNIQATFVRGLSALGQKPAGEQQWALVENFVDLGSIPMARMCPHLGSKSAPPGWSRLGALPVADALCLAAPARNRALHSTLGATAPAMTVSQAEEDILLTRGRTTGELLDALHEGLTAASQPIQPSNGEPAASAAAADSALRALLTPRGLQAIKGMHKKNKEGLVRALLAALRTELTGPLNFRFVTRLGALHHATYHQAPVRAPAGRLAGTHVAVDGSRKEHADGSVTAAGSISGTVPNSVPGPVAASAAAKASACRSARSCSLTRRR